MSFFVHLEARDCDYDVKCHECKQTFHVEWSTEYGEPLIGEHTVTCPKCGASISFGVYHQYTQEE